MRADSDSFAVLVAGTIVAERLIFPGPGFGADHYPQLRLSYDSALTLFYVGVHTFDTPFPDSGNLQIDANTTSPGVFLTTGTSSGFGGTAELALVGENPNLAWLRVASSSRSATLQLGIDVGNTQTGLTSDADLTTFLLSAAAGSYWKVRSSAGVDLAKITAAAGLVLSAALGVPSGGTGVTTHTAGNFLKGNGASAITSQAGINFSDLNGAAAGNPVNAPRRNGVFLTMSSAIERWYTLGKIVIQMLDYTFTSAATTAGTEIDIYTPNPGQPLSSEMVCGVADYFDSAGVVATYKLITTIVDSGGGVYRLRFRRTDTTTASYLGVDPNPAASLAGDRLRVFAVYFKV